LEKFQTGDKLRISKFLSSKNIGSRKDIEKLIMEKRISLNGIIITTPITFVSETDLICLDNKLINTKQKFEILKYYKPVGFITSHKKQDKRPIIFENLPAKYKNFKTAGRLDYNSEGLLILSTNGEVTRKLELPKNKFQRKYEVTISGGFKNENLKMISLGIKIKNILYKPFKYSIKSHTKKSVILELILIEGKNREIRKLMEYIKLKVTKLKRIEYGPFKLNELKPGEIHSATKPEINNYLNNTGI
jgi:23S rRNA pseudouridine2605 synthase